MKWVTYKDDQNNAAERTGVLSVPPGVTVLEFDRAVPADCVQPVRRRCMQRRWCVWTT
jgi:hypothetical protein